MRGSIALAVVLAVVAAVVILGRRAAPPAPPPAPPTEIVPVVKPVYPVTLVLECEEPDTLTDRFPWGDPPQEIIVMRIGQANEGQLIKYLEIPDGWQNSCGLDSVKDDPDKVPGRATYHFDAPRDDTYYLNLRAKWFDSCGNSVYARIDTGEWYNLEDENGLIKDKNYKWAWHQLFLGGRPKGFELKAGRHTLGINTREDGPKLDQIVISSDANPPVGDNPVTPPPAAPQKKTDEQPTQEGVHP